MALDNFTGQNIKDTFQRVVQTDGGAFADGTGSAISIVTSDQTASLALSANISGAFADTSSSFSTRISNLKSDSASLASKVTVLEGNPVFSADGISGSFNAIGLLSSSAQIADDISGSFSAIGLISSSVQIKDDISGSLGTNATFIRSLTTGSISGSATKDINELSASFALDTNVQNVSASAITASSLLVNTDTRLFGSFALTGMQVIQDTITTRSGSTVAGSGSNPTSTSHEFTGSVFITGSDFKFNGVDVMTSSPFTPESISGSFHGQTGSFVVNSQTASFGITGNDVNFADITASGNITASGDILTTNINVGTPTSNNWGENLQGSFFNTFNETTDVSEILRFVAGLLSSSAASPTANTKTYGLSTQEDSLGTTQTISGRIPQNVTAVGNATINYLVAKGFAEDGETIFNGISVYHDNFSSYNINFDSSAQGSTTVQSSADSQLFGLGLLDSGNATDFKVKIISTQSFSDNTSNTAPTEASNTFTSQSKEDLSINSFGTSNGLTLAKISTDNPAVIPPTFQDGKFIAVGGLHRKYHASLTSETSVSASGYYRFHGLKVGIASGSSPYQFIAGSTKNKFWAPVDQISTNIGNNSISDTGTTQRALTITSRSLSGAPYMIDATYEVSTKITGLFSPMYAGSSTNARMTSDSVGVGSVSISGGTLNTSGGTIQTTGKVFQSDGTTAVNSGVPRHNDIVIITGSISYNSGTSTNITQTGFTDEDFFIRVRAKNRSGGESIFDTQTINYHSDGDFDQPSASGSLAVYGQAQGHDGGSLTGTTEQFTGEDHRIKLLNNVLAFNGTAFDTTFNIDRPFLGDYDLQVKPGYLVDPGGTYRYWYPSGYGAGTYKFYIRRFRTSGTKTSMTVNVGKTLVNWTSTATGAAIALLFKSSGTNGHNTSFSSARLYDPSATSDNLIEAGVSADNTKNPFTDDIDLYGNTGGSKSSTTYTVPIRNADGMFLDNNDNELYVIVRYKGTFTPIQSITLGFS